MRDVNRPQADRLADFRIFRAALETGTIRAAERDAVGNWHVNTWVKQGILAGFPLGEMEDVSVPGFPFFDKATYPVQSFTLGHKVRIVPGGTTIRSGAYVAPGVVCMPPSYINVGAYVDEGAMVDSHALVGSAAQIGKKVHLSAAAQIGGVLEPAGALPVIVEDHVFIGGNCGVYEGCLIRERAVLASGVILTGSSRVYDLVNERVITRNESGVLEIPAGAVVVPGSRKVSSVFGASHGLSVSTPIVVKYRDDKTDAALALEDALR
ncbi:MAG TPA: 2,3,4,5-tetrahydropyridine-2,6-dicarboxylate N-succinyltransferase [Rhodothermales bacterium]|nr:2,3,4,5-tetrahydropyridine-2,6-dicarboxylate N-succinyltransferase [Rhodothermales bacterium]